MSNDTSRSQPQIAELPTEWKIQTVYFNDARILGIYHHEKGLRD